VSFLLISFSRSCGFPKLIPIFAFLGNIFIQTNLGTEIFDYKNNIEVSLLLPLENGKTETKTDFFDFFSTLSPIFLTLSEPTLDPELPL